MADRLTQLQDEVNKVIQLKPNITKFFFLTIFPIFFPQQAEHFCNSLGVLQQCSTPSKFAGFDRTGSQTPQQSTEDYALLFSTLISRCAKDIDAIIDSLPSEENSETVQNQALRKLENENQVAADRLEEVVRKGEVLLETIQNALSEIAQAQLDMKTSLTPKTAK